jgi:ferritin-like metal-binding protein YciE
MIMQNENQTDSRREAFFQDQLRDIYWAEQHLVKTIPKMVDAASSNELKSALNEHLSVTKGHVTRLEHVFDLLNQEPEANKCKAMAGIIDEGEDIIDDTEEKTDTRNVGVVFAARKVEHYEIATYSSIIQLAKALGHDDISNILEQTLSEEKEADEGLFKLAENFVNTNVTQEQD